ncbi:MAG TPA: hemolysin family protein [Microbacteriaceae bacterium]|nr:hemolysin family protein [Microbacteriaceae bacterium]
MNEWVLLSFGVLLTVGTGLFVASEFAIVNLDRPELEARRERGERRLGLTIDALKHTSTHLSSAQLGITLTTLLAGFTLEPALSSMLSAPLAAIGVSSGVERWLAPILAVTIATLGSMVLGELVPKNFALAVPLATARIVLPFQVGFSTLFKPAIGLLNGSANRILTGMGIEPQEELSAARSAEELASLVRRSAQEGLLEHDTASLLDRTLRFSRLNALDVMTPRPRLEVVEAGESAEDIIALARRTGLSRFPVIGEDIDDVIGVVHIKNAVAVPSARRADVPAQALAVEPLRVPETMPLDSLMGALRERGFQLAVVVDEYGGTAGVATLEDLVEELIGDVSDEHDRRSPGVVRKGDSVTFPGLQRPDEVRDAFGLEVPEGTAYDTVGGFVMAALGRLPKVGDTVPVAGGRLEVMRLEGRRIDRLRFVPEPEVTE